MGHTFLEENEIKQARAEERARAAAILKDLLGTCWTSKLMNGWPEAIARAIAAKRKEVCGE